MQIKFVPFFVSSIARIPRIGQGPPNAVEPMMMMMMMMLFNPKVYLFVPSIFIAS